MNHKYAVVLASSLLGAPCPANANFDGDITRSLTLRCSYSDYESFQFEAVSIEVTKERSGEVASIKTFTRGPKSEQTTFLVKAGQVAECVFPSGNQVRTKVGETTARPYGMCGANPEVFASVWVNKRKIASRIWFSGHCRGEGGYPDVSFKISGGRAVSIQKCHSARQPEAESSGNDSRSLPKQPLSVCVDFPEISRFPRDVLEYPEPSTKVLAVGDIELVAGTHEVCDAVRQELNADFDSFGNYSHQKAIKLSRPSWSSPSAELPKELAGSSESTFYFDNDGKLDRIFGRKFETNYMDSSVLLIQPGSSFSKLSVSDAPMDKTSNFLPCQMDPVRYEIPDCPTFSQQSDEGGFLMKGRTDNDTVFFRARYSSVSPFMFQGANYIGVSSKSEDTKEFVAVLKPLPNRKFQSMCLLRRVTENF